MRRKFADLDARHEMYGYCNNYKYLNKLVTDIRVVMLLIEYIMEHSHWKKVTDVELIGEI